jgi:hypothetical protein
VGIFLSRIRAPSFKPKSSSPTLIFLKSSALMVSFSMGSSYCFPGAVVGDCQVLVGIGCSQALRRSYFHVQQMCSTSPIRRKGRRSDSLDCFVHYNERVEKEAIFFKQGELKTRDRESSVSHMRMPAMGFH